MTPIDAALTTLRAVVVEDSPTQALSIRQRVQRCGFAVRMAANGEEALALVDQELPTVVLTDLEMPVMDGVELVKQLKRQFAGLPVVVMTAQGSEEAAVESLRAGAAGYVPKQRLEQDLPRILESILAISRANKGQHAISLHLCETVSRYELPNDLSLIPPLINRLQQNLDRLHLFPQSEQMRIGMALREALVNAVEHGNLEASSDLRETDDAAYRRLLAERRSQDPYQQRCVRLTARESRQSVEYAIRDEGPGFDPNSLPDPTDPENIIKVSGRGLLLIQSFMDRVSHNAAGSEITMLKFVTRQGH